MRSPDDAVGRTDVVSALMLLAVLWPVRQNWRQTPRDSFPLSYYPMFSARRRRRVRMTYLVGVDPSGRRRLLPYTCAGSGGLNQVRRQMNRMVRAGAADKLCRQVAEAVARRRSPEMAAVTTVEVVRGRFDLSDYFHGDTAPRSEERLAACPVPGR